jgi:tetratricopeptide (TPR) repeat protein
VRRPVEMLVLAVTLLAVGGWARADGALCQSAGPRATSARAALAAKRASLPARFELADALIESSCYHDAVHTLEEGKAIHPRSAELTAKLRNAQSLLSEQDYFEGKEQAELAAKLSRNLLRCTRLADVDACDEALKLKPDDVQLLLAKGDALLKASRPGEAEAAYRRARQIAPQDARVTTQLAAARAQRQPLLERCQQDSDDAALQACQGALSKGADDERAILARMASLRQARSQAIPVAAAPRPAQVPAPLAASNGPAASMVATRSYSNAAEPGRSH